MDTEITIIGAGVIGLAIAEKISEEYNDVFVIERHNTFGQETSSRNSEVIHAGIYYPRGSLKARLCVEGRDLLYRYCREHDIPFNNCGKLIVATSEPEIEVIEEIQKTAAGNGVELESISVSRIRELEPEIFALGALWSPLTGIIDTHALMKCFESGTLSRGGQIVYGSEVKSIKKKEKGYELTILDADGQYFTFSSRIVINSAGLSSDKLSEMAGMVDENLKIRFCKGEYFGIRPPKNRLLKRLVYPVPYRNLEGIGIHVTIDMGGRARLGPDVTYLETNEYDYRVDSDKLDAFFMSARKFLPFLEPSDLYPEMAGIRPKIQRHGEAVRDFYIMEETGRGCPGFINLIGMESPGLTSCLAIANHVLTLIR
ncbi:MAG TPA: NAD(P)/FAD-dependent oxidoreductase [Bacteroidales bacterium]|nr:NAD(P)/FAD-dependent oxidoreductase [Bacteroidales bacterium]HPF03948.1 NAD(P)/FAD-dependent oxidoreductase [Bacteroidales bacterium]HPJ58505.1 NAD(P)/FAD-dependent oxidoreductase [Bacteroidales bacterium]HPR11680.1 NAD(P)/FAD-dependent oxidoreductase [Bacteroidales bacterium]HRW85515.1 NAD(P)/FAD-dependent oxidoreductase [Bacteroidales bacterium]